MKNNTKIRLHLSKNLFETIAKEVLAEAKKKDMSGGVYTEMVKGNTKKYGPALPTKTKPGETAAEKHSPEKHKADQERKINEKEQIGGPKSPEEKKTSRMTGINEKQALMKAKAMLEKRLAEMEINVAEEEE